MNGEGRRICGKWGTVAGQTTPFYCNAEPDHGTACRYRNATGIEFPLVGNLEEVGRRE